MGLLDQFKAYVQANTPRNTRKPVSPGRVIDQGLFGGRVAQIPQRAQEIQRGLLNVPNELAALGSPGMRQQVQQAMNNPGELDKEAGMQMAMDFLQTTMPAGGLLAHTVYHGSPHKFDKFDMSKIGTGEGAQAYGHGLYFAESPGVANSYVTNPGGLFTVKGKTYGELQSQWGEFDKPTRRALSALADSQGNADEAIGNLKGMMSPESNQAADVLKQWVDSGDVLKNTGNMYKVDIPDEAIPRMLDWDKRMYEQSPDVLQKMPGLADSGKRYNDISQEMDALMWQGKLDSPEWEALKNESKLIRETLGYAPNDTGEELMRKLGGNVKASEYLKQQGIPGIRYLDGSSRNVGEGTSNFVLFDDQLPRILEINGQPTGLLSYADEAKKAQSGLLDNDYLYHGTGEGAFRKIREQGLVPKNNKIYATDSEKYAKTYAKRKGSPYGERVLRMKKSGFVADQSNAGGDFITNNQIDPNLLEVLVNGKYIPLSDYVDESIGLMPIKQK
jgi:hypothetical protein